MRNAMFSTTGKEKYHSVTKTLDQINTELEAYIDKHCPGSHVQLDGTTGILRLDYRFAPTDLLAIAKIASQPTLGRLQGSGSVELDGNGE